VSLSGCSGKTGAERYCSGVGFGICHRLILQLSNAHPEDAQLQLASVVDTNDLGDITFDPCEGLTLVMACRSISRAEKARTELYGLLDEDLARRKATGTYDSHAKRFRENLHIELQQLDLASMTSVFRAAGEISQRCVSPHPYRVWMLTDATYFLDILPYLI
jgi:3-keto steroid reductase